MASLFERMSLIVRSNINELMDKFEDPAAVIDQVVLDAKKDYAKCKKDSAQVLANERKTQDDLDECNQNIKKWNTIAEKAVMAGDDGDATRALENAAEWEGKLPSYQERANQAKAQADALRKKLNDMAEQIKDMESKSADIKADMANAKAAKTTARVSGKIGSSAFDQFDRLAEKAASQRREAEAMAEFEDDPVGASDRDLEKKYAGAGTSPVSDRLAALKAKMGKE